MNLTKRDEDLRNFILMEKLRTFKSFGLYDLQGSQMVRPDVLLLTVGAIERVLIKIYQLLLNSNSTW